MDPKLVKAIRSWLGFRSGSRDKAKHIEVLKAIVEDRKGGLQSEREMLIYRLRRYEVEFRFKELWATAEKMLEEMAT